MNFFHYHEKLPFRRGNQYKVHITMDWKQSLILSLCLGQIQTIEREMTFPIKAQSEECFYETALISQVIEIDYQIVDAGSEGRFAIDFSITKPDGQPHLVEYDKSENTHQVLFLIKS